jgi:hypothetical protein
MKGYGLENLCVVSSQTLDDASPLIPRYQIPHRQFTALQKTETSGFFLFPFPHFDRLTQIGSSNDLELTHNTTGAHIVPFHVLLRTTETPILEIHDLRILLLRRWSSFSSQVFDHLFIHPFIHLARISLVQQLVAVTWLAVS